MYRSLTIPQHSDPVARGALIACVVAMIWLAFAPGQPGAAPQTADAAAPIIIIATATPALPTLAPISAGVPGELAVPTAAPPIEQSAGGQATVQAQAPQTEEPGSALVHNADGSTTLPGSEDWLELAPAVETQDASAPNPLAVDPAVYQALPPQGALTESNQQPNYARRPSTGR